MPNKMDSSDIFTQTQLRKEMASLKHWGGLWNPKAQINFPSTTYGWARSMINYPQRNKKS